MTCSPTSRPCRRCRGRYATTTCRFRSPSAARSAAGSCSSSTASSSRRTGQVGCVESRRLSGERSRPLRRMPQPAQPARRHHREPAFRRRAQSGRRGLDSQHHAEGALGDCSEKDLAYLLETGDTPSGDVGGQMTGRAQHRAAFPGRPQRARALHQDAAADRGAEAAAEK